ncbi:hypothetical protein L7F22_014019 [Adiantum nelumboides]|nr:hypothetical protein [Adiantum nelumboides]
MDTGDIIFDGMDHRNLILWNAMMSGQALNDMSEKVFHFLNQMQQEGLLPNTVTYNIVLDACISALVNMYGRCGSLDGALGFFHQMNSHQDTILWSTMISVYAKHGIYSKAMQLYRQMGKQKIAIDKVMFISILSLQSREADLDYGGRVHIHATLNLDTSVGNVLVSMYGVCGSFPDAHGDM